MTISTPVPAFFESGTPPPQLPLATAFTELSYNHPATVTAFEELPSQVTACPRNATPPDDDAIPPDDDAIPPEDDDAPEDDNASGSSNCAHDSWEMEEDKIPKPRGEPGRPHSGGYNLENVLAKNGWGSKKFKKLKVNCYILPNIPIISYSRH